MITKFVETNNIWFQCHNDSYLNSILTTWQPILLKQGTQNLGVKSPIGYTLLSKALRFCKLESKGHLLHLMFSRWSNISVWIDRLAEANFQRVVQRFPDTRQHYYLTYELNSLFSDQLLVLTCLKVFTLSKLLSH